jgi:peptide/nickel transport system substrate-binding protein
VADSHRQGTRRRHVRIAAVAAALGLVASAFAGAATASTGERRAHQSGGGELTFGLEAENTNYCLPRAQLAISGIQVVAAIYDTLTVPNAKGEIVPYLASAVEPNADFTEWTITLREGVVFHDGTPLDADAVKANLDSYRGAPGAPNSGPLLTILFKFISDVSVVDPLNVKVTLSVPVTDFPAYLYSTGRLGIVAPAQLNAGEACATNMIGTGPFKLEEYNQNESTIVVKNEDYWQEGYPKAEKITFVPVVDGAVRVNQLQGGQLDLMHTSGALQIDTLESLGSQVKMLLQKPGLREIRYYFLLSGDAPFSNPTAREAFALALDRNKINEIRNKGIFEVANSLMDRNSPGYVKNAGYPKYNLNKAKAAVQEVIAADGSFNVILGTTTDPDNSAEAQLLKEELEKSGMTVEIAQFDQATLINKALSRDIDVLLWRNLHGGFTGHNDADTFIWFANADTGNLVNFGGFSDPATQALLDQGRAQTDINEIQQTYQDFNKAMAEAVYLLPAWYVNWAIGSQPNVKVALPKLPDGGGKALFVYGRIPVIGLSKS